VESSRRSVARTPVVSTVLQPSVAVNPRDPRRIERRAGGSAPLFLDSSNGSGSSKRPLARRLEGCVQGFRRRRGPGRDLPAHRFRWLYPSEALLVATVLAILPYLVVRGPVNRIASYRTKDSNAR